MANKLNPLQRAYLIGLRRGKAQAQRELDEIAGDLLNLSSRLQDERDGLRRDVTNLVRGWDQELADLAAEVADIGREHERIKAVAEAMVERAQEPEARLH